MTRECGAVPTKGEVMTSEVIVAEVPVEGAAMGVWHAALRRQASS